jgi:anthranilate phosphoribosyltransferase
MRKILERLFNHEELDRAQTRQLMLEIIEEKYNESQIASLLTVYRMRPISIEEFAGFRSALLELMKRIDYDQSEIIDMCGTGGDGKNTFNISTLASVVVAGAGYKVAKHGNAAVSSVCGSSNVIQGMGYQFSNENEVIQKQLDKYNLTFMHAPLFHSALKPVGPVRRALGFKTFFNMIGPLVNPAQPEHQVAGVFSLEVMPFYKSLMEEEGKKFSIIHGLDGYDELSLTGTTKIITEEGDHLLDPEDLGRKKLNPEDIFGAETISGSIDIFNTILSGEGTSAQNEVVLTNAAIGIQVFNRNKSFSDCYDEAKTSLLSGNAKRNLENLIASTN